MIKKFKQLIPLLLVFGFLWLIEIFTIITWGEECIPKEWSSFR